MLEFSFSFYFNGYGKYDLFDFKVLRLLKYNVFSKIFLIPIAYSTVMLTEDRRIAYNTDIWFLISFSKWRINIELTYPAENILLSDILTWTTDRLVWDGDILPWLCPRGSISTDTLPSLFILFHFCNPLFSISEPLK